MRVCINLAVLILLLTISTHSSMADGKVELKTSIFAGGCFWCMEPPFEHMDGVISAVSGYTGGTVDSPSYKQVSGGGTGHYEVVQITYNPDVISYKTLLEIFWRNIDPYDSVGQFCDKGQQYLAAIFVENEDEKQAALESKQKYETSFNKDIVTSILPRTKFYKAEDYHQDYYKNNQYRYKFYRAGCGRDRRLKELWGDEAGGYTIIPSK